MAEYSATDVVKESTQNAMLWLSNNHQVLLEYATNLLMAVIIFVAGKWFTKCIAMSLVKRKLDQTVVDFCENFAAGGINRNISPVQIG